MRELALFAGAGGGILGGKLLGWRTVCAVEVDAYARRVLLARQRDGMLSRFPVWDDVRTFDGRGWAGQIDVVSGGFPCQDISSAGRGAGIQGAKSGLWQEMARIVRQVRPDFVFVENSPILTTRGIHVVLGDLAAMGFDARWGVLGARHAGAPHLRKRIWILAYAQEHGRREGRPGRPDTGGTREPEQSLQAVHDPLRGRHRAPQEEVRPGRHCIEHPGWWGVEPALDRVAHGVADRVDRIRALGNGQVPAVAAMAWRLLAGEDTQ